MKFRDYIFWTCLTLLSITLGAWLRQPHSEPASVPRPRATWFSKATYWLALARLARGAPETAPPPRQELPDAIVNAPATREVGPDGEPLLAHGAGW